MKAGGRWRAKILLEWATKELAPSRKGLELEFDICTGLAAEGAE